MNVDPQVFMAILAMASKACEFSSQFQAGLIAANQHVEASQVRGLEVTTINALGKLDAEFPGMLPVPHDGRQWKDRAA